MTIRRLIELFRDQRHDGQLGEDQIRTYVNAVETRLCEEIFLTHEDPPLRVFSFLGRPPHGYYQEWPPMIPHEPGYSDEWSFDDYMDIPLLALPPYDDLYRAYIQWQTDLSQNDVVDAGNSQRIYVNAYNDFARYWNRTHLPIDKTPYKGYYKG